VLDSHTDYKGNLRWLCPICAESQNYDTTRCIECGRTIGWQDQIHSRAENGVWEIYCDICAPETHSDDLTDIGPGKGKINRRGVLVNERST
jgi:hypothetical protein